MLHALLSMSAACLALSGCGNGLAQVSGQVTLDGQPLHGGNGDIRVTVQFQPASGVGATAIGLADENGNYEIGNGLPNGNSAGRISCHLLRERARSIEESEAARLPTACRSKICERQDVRLEIYGAARQERVQYSACKSGKDDVSTRRPSRSHSR